ncbi:vWA domain-containing protein [Candidatus Laterigemmans baculatus]|uniref:vWA domain-containing protein n=1 Tax=Candidatus Laterigemmans baculatus TaxID=2770505 RepID=UPI0013DD3EFF|nr:vWA domain-containing protein [Candidatus Laterigemmans baculatus]
MSVPSGSPPKAFTLWADSASERSGRGIDWQLEPLGPVPLWGLGLLAVALLGLVVLFEFVRLRSGPFQLGPLASRRQGAAGPPPLALRRRIVLVAVRAATLGVIVWMLGGWSITRFETELPDLVVLVDASQSMGLPHSDSASGEGLTRWESVLGLLGHRDGRLLRQLSEDYRLRIQLIGAPLTTASDGDLESLLGELRRQSPSAASSPLGDALTAAASAQRGRSTAALVMISDGVVTEGIALPEAAREIAAGHVPVITVSTGSQNPPPQVEVAELVSDTAAMVGDRVTVVARIRWTGTEGRPIRLRLLDEADGAELAAESIPTGRAAGTRTVELHFLATARGVRRLRLEAEPLAGEVAPEDNFKEAVVEIRDESFRVLLVEGGPSYEFRFLKHLLERATDQAGERPLVELISVLQQGDPRYADQDRTARRLPPVDDETLERLDLIILSDCDPAALGTRLQSRIVDLVTRGGASLVVIAGPNHLPQALAGTPLERLLPLEPSRVTAPRTALDPLRWDITPLGRAMPNLRIEVSRDAWSTAPPIYWLADVPSLEGALRPGARVLIETPQRLSGGRPAPIVVSQLAGHGQVWLQLTDESFRLRLADPNAALYERYWLQLVRSLAKRSGLGGGDRTTLTIRGERFPEGRPVPFRVQLAEAAMASGDVEIAVSDREGRTVTVRGSEDPAAGGQFRGVIEGLEAGAYRAVLTRPAGGDQPPSDSFVVEADPLEMKRPMADLTALGDVAAITGGSLLGIDEAAEQLIEAIPPGREVRIRPLPAIPVWNHPLVALLLFAGLASEWLLRRRWGSV